MTENSPYKGVLHLGLLLVVLPLAVYSLAFGKTIQKYIGYRNEQKMLTALEISTTSTDRPETILFSNENLVQTGLLLHRLSETLLRYGVTVEKYTPYTFDGGNQILLHTAELVLQGDYIDLVRVIEYVQENLPECKLLSVHFKSEKIQSSNERRLKVTLLLQQIMQSY